MIWARRLKDRRTGIQGSSRCNKEALHKEHGKYARGRELLIMQGRNALSLVHPGSSLDMLSSDIEQPIAAPSIIIVQAEKSNPYETVLLSL